MKNNSFFKTLFWILTAVIIGFIGLMMVKAGLAIVGLSKMPLATLLLFVFILIIVLSVYTAIALFIYRDAPKRGMDRWMWMTIALFVPNLIGLLIYFVVRSTNNTKCLNCGKGVRNDFELCPYCGSSLKAQCPQCGKQVSAEWALCPYCKTNLK